MQILLHLKLNICGFSFATLNWITLTFEKLGLGRVKVDFALIASSETSAYCFNEKAKCRKNA